MSSNSPANDRKPSAEVGADLKRLGKYRIERRLGVGGMGTVYLAVDTDLNRTVALKVLAKERAQNPTLVRRFKSEGQAAALMKHENIVSVFESGQIDGYLYLALEFIEGADVLELIRRYGQIPVKRSIEIVRQTAAALQHACEKGIVHRDIKPSNLMVARDGTVKLTDMGLARVVDDAVDTSITRDGTTVGTVDYMAPEQAADSRAADIRSDLYSLGCTWYHMLTGHPPYPEGGVTAKLTAHATYPIPNPRDFNPDVPEAVVAVIQRLLAKKREQRYQTPEELLADLESAGLRRGDEPVDLLAIFSEDDGDEAPSHYDDEGNADPDVSTREISSLSADPRSTGPRRLPQRESSPARSDDDDVGESRTASGHKPEKKREVLRRLDFDVPPKKPDDVEPVPEKTKVTPPRRPANQPQSPHEPSSRDRQKSDSNRPQDSARRSAQAKGSKQVTPPAINRDAVNIEADAPEASETPEVTLKDLQARSRRRKSEQGLPIDDDDVDDVSVGRRESASAKAGLASTPGPSADKPKTVAARRVPKPLPVAGQATVAARRENGDRKSLFGNASIQLPRIEPVRFIAAAAVLIALIGVVRYLSRLGDDVSQEVTVPSESPAAESQNVRLGPPQEPAAERQDMPQEAVSERESTAEELSRRNPSLEDILPEWLRSGWARPPRRDLPVVTVRRGGGRASASAPAFDQAVPQFSGGEGRIIFGDAEPRQFTGAKVQDLRRLILSGPESKPATVFIFEHSLVDGSWLSFTGGTLEVENLHFVIELDPSKGENRPLFSLRDANVLLRNCTFIVRGSAAVSLAAITGTSRDGNRVLIENCYAAGTAVTMLDVREAQCDSLLANCALATNSGSLYSQSAASDAGTTTLRIVATTTVTGAQVVNLIGGRSGNPLGNHRIEARQSLFAGTGTADSTCVRISAWRNAMDPTTAPAAVTLKTEHVRFAGWSALARMSDARGQGAVVADADSWGRFWKDPIPSDDLIPEVPGLRELEFNSAPPLEILRQRLEPISKAGLGVRSLLGARIEDLSEPQAEILDRAAALAESSSLLQRTREPFTTSRTVRFDLSRSATLPAFLASGECPDGTHVVCFGAGARTLPLLHLRNRRLHLSFEQGEGAPLSFTPEPAESAAAVLLVEGGEVTISGLNCTVPASSTKEYPGTFLRARQGGIFRLQDCEITGIARPKSTAALVEMESSTRDEGVSVISGSVLRTGGTAIRCDLDRQSLVVENCIVAAGGDGVAITNSESGGEWLMLRGSTFACDGSAVRCSSLQRPLSADVLAVECVFGPLDEGVRNAAVLAVAAKPAAGEAQPWWEEACGHSSLLGAPFIIDSMPAGSGFSAGWTERLGPARVQASIQGVRSVLFAESRKPLKDLTAASLRLDPSCQAATWSGDGGPLGADVRNVGPPRGSRDSTPKTAPEKPQQSGRSQF